MNWSHKIWKASQLSVLVIICGATNSASAPNPGIAVGFLFPPDNSANMERNVGAKFMDLDFRRDDGTAILSGDSNLPINIASATVTITINPPAPTVVNCIRGNLAP